MNKLINDFDRGFSLKNDDLRFIDAAVRLALADICKALGGATAILWGCNYTIVGTALTVAEGAIFHDGEIWHVEAHGAVVANPVVTGPYWCFATSFHAAGAKLDMDLVSHNTYQVRTAFANATGTGSGVIASELFADVRAWLDVLFDIADAVLTMTAGVTNTSGQAHRKNGLILFSGKITAPLSASAKNVMDIPIGFRPVTPLRGYFPVEKTDTLVDYMAIYSIDSSGHFQISLLNGAPTGDYNIMLTVPTYQKH